MNKKAGIIIGTILFSLLFFLLPLNKAQAAKIFSEPEKQEVQAGQKFKVEFFLDTKKRSIGALEGKILFPQGWLKLEQIYELNSIVGYWVEPPRKGDEGIVFAGVIPGGFVGDRGSIFSLVFEATEEGRGRVDLNGVKVLLNDGKGTEISTITSGMEFFISPATEGSHDTDAEGISTSPGDSTPPDPFTPEIAQDENVFNNQWFLSFLARDVGYGIDHYEVFESKRQFDKVSIKEAGVEWKIAESPYLLRDQKLESYIFVKAVDKMKNETIEVIRPKNKDNSARNLIIAAISFVVLLIVVIFIAKEFKKNKTK